METVMSKLPKRKPFSSLKGDERRWRIEEAANTLKRSISIQKEVAEIRKDKGLLKAVKMYLQEEILETQRVKNKI